MGALSGWNIYWGHLLATLFIGDTLVSIDTLAICRVVFYCCIVYGESLWLTLFMRKLTGCNVYGVLFALHCTWDHSLTTLFTKALSHRHCQFPYFAVIVFQGPQVVGVRWYTNKSWGSCGHCHCAHMITGKQPHCCRNCRDWRKLQSQSLTLLVL